MHFKKLYRTGLLTILGTLMLSTQAHAYWAEYEDGWKFIKSDGTCITSSWEWIDGNFDTVAECYYFDADGYLVTDTKTLDGYTVNENGTWTVDGIVQEKDLKGLVGWIDINGEKMYVENDGLIWRERITPDGKYVNCHGWVVESEIDDELMSEKSKDSTYIVIDKSTHHLERWENGVQTHEFVVSCGTYDGDKVMEGDRRTPEGEFYVCKKIPTSSYHLALGVSYPAIEDADRGLAMGIINQSQYDGIVAANLAGSTPNWHTRLGGYIEIHGNRQAVANSSAGCVAMSNQEIELLYSITKKGDKILIQA